MKEISVAAKPEPFTFDHSSAAILIIDMQKDFILESGFGDSLGNDVSLLQSSIQPCEQLLDWARSNDLLVIHTREGHLANLANVFESKLKRGKPSARIGDKGPMGRILIRGETGHDFVEELRPKEGEIIIDKAGKGAFYSTELDLILRKHRIETIIFAGVTTEVCVSSTVREANDRGYMCLVVDECCASYFPEFHQSALAMIAAQGGIFGSVCSLSELVSDTSQSEN